MKFRKKPVVIEAEQWWSNQSETRGVKYRNEYTKEDLDRGRIRIREGAYVETIHEGQTVDLEPGDWVIPEPDGIHFYPCKPDIFAATYSPFKQGPSVFDLLEIAHLRIMFHIDPDRFQELAEDDVRKVTLNLLQEPLEEALRREGKPLAPDFAGRFFAEDYRTTAQSVDILQREIVAT